MPEDAQPSNDFERTVVLQSGGRSFAELTGAGRARFATELASTIRLRALAAKVPETRSVPASRADDAPVDDAPEPRGKGRDEDRELITRVLEPAVRALELGNWRPVLAPAASGLVPSSLEATRLAAVLRLVARSMQHQALGELTEAWTRLSQAAEGLPTILKRKEDDAVLAVLVAPPTGSGIAHLTWRVSRVIWREQRELAELRSQSREYPRARDELVDSYVEYLRWVELDPFAWRESGSNRDLHTRSRSEITRRATELRRFRSPTSTTAVSSAVWQNIGGQPGLHAAAQERLANTDLVPWQGAGAIADVPVRRGRLRAWQQARNWVDDLNESL